MKNEEFNKAVEDFVTVMQEKFNVWGMDLQLGCESYEYKAVTARCKPEAENGLVQEIFYGRLDEDVSQDFVIESEGDYLGHIYDDVFLGLDNEKLEGEIVEKLASISINENILK